MRYIQIIIVLLLACTVNVQAQVGTDQSLALQYYNNSEYEKAAELYEKLHNKYPQTEIYYRYLYNSWLNIKEYDKLEKVVKRMVKKNPETLYYLVDLGYLHKEMGDIAASQAADDTARGCTHTVGVALNGHGTNTFNSALLDGLGAACFAFAIHLA